VVSDVQMTATTTTIVMTDINRRTPRLRCPWMLGPSI
jgi:hypothetical protein